MFFKKVYCFVKPGVKTQKLMFKITPIAPAMQNENKKQKLKKICKAHCK